MYASLFSLRDAYSFVLVEVKRHINANSRVTTMLGNGGKAKE